MATCAADPSNLEAQTEPLFSLRSVEIGGKAVHLMDVCRCAYLYVWVHEDWVGRVCFWLPYVIRTMTKNVQRGLPPAVMLHTPATYSICPHRLLYFITSVPVRKCWGVCPHRCLVKTKLHVWTISSSSARVYISWTVQWDSWVETTQTCVWDTLVCMLFPYHSEGCCMRTSDSKL